MTDIRLDRLNTAERNNARNKARKILSALLPSATPHGPPPRQGTVIATAKRANGWHVEIEDDEGQLHHLVPRLVNFQPTMGDRVTLVYVTTPSSGLWMAQRAEAQ